MPALDLLTLERPVAEIREESETDRDAIREMIQLAFGAEAEARLVDRLRSDGDAIVSVVAVQDRRIAGHALFSRLPIHVEKGQALQAMALAPVAVRPGFQRRGIGTNLIRAGLDLCRNRDHRIVIVVGDPAFYTRFGFSAAKAQTLSSPYAGESFMALELVAGALDGVAGTVIYPPAFDLVE